MNENCVQFEVRTVEEARALEKVLEADGVFAIHPGLRDTLRRVRPLMIELGEDTNGNPYFVYSKIKSAACDQLAF